MQCEFVDDQLCVCGCEGVVEYECICIGGVCFDCIGGVVECMCVFLYECVDCMVVCGQFVDDLLDEVIVVCGCCWVVQCGMIMCEYVVVCIGYYVVYDVCVGCDQM